MMYSCSSARTKFPKEDMKEQGVFQSQGGVPPPTGHLALVFTDVRNSTRLWQENPGMPAAIQIQNHLLRRQLRICGGYEVKAEGDAFMCSFQNAMSAVWFGLTFQNQLLHAPWPSEILQCDDGKERYDSRGRLVARGLPVRMGIHCGSPFCEWDSTATQRMDYFGPVVHRSARISGYGDGGQVACSAAVVREINALILKTKPETKHSRFQPPQAVDAVKRLGLAVIFVGEVKLKGLEVSETLTLVHQQDQECQGQGHRAGPS